MPFSSLSTALSVSQSRSITGGNDKQGFPMKQGILSTERVRILMKKGVSCYRPRARGERKRKSVRGCIVAADLAVLNLVVEKKGEGEIPALDQEADLPLHVATIPCGAGASKLHSLQQ